MEQPHLIVVTGRPGAGKTTFAHAMGRQVYLPVVSRDEIKEGYVHTANRPHADLPEETNRGVNEAFFGVLLYMVEHGVSVIAEAAFQHKLWSQYLEPFMDKARVSLILCDVDGETALNRFLARGLQDERRLYFHGDKGVAMVKQGQVPLAGDYQPPHLPVPTVRVNTVGEYQPSIDEIARQLNVTAAKE